MEARASEDDASRHAPGWENWERRAACSTACARGGNQRKKGLHADLDVTGFGDVTGEFFNVTRGNNQDSINAPHMCLAPDRRGHAEMRSYRATSPSSRDFNSGGM